MKKLTKETAQKYLTEGKVVQCRVSSREVIPVREISKLKDLIRLKELGVYQLCEIFIETNKALPKNAMEISMEDALDLIQKGEIIYGRKPGEDGEDEEITTRNALFQFYRSASITGNPELYWMP